VLALLLPERDSSPESKTDALLEIQRLGIERREIVITPMLEALGIYRPMPLHVLGLRRINWEVVRRQFGSQAAAPTSLLSAPGSSVPRPWGEGST
jgi:hypothetical protein